MALTRKFLTALGIEAEKVDEIITAHTETVEALKEQRDQYKADAEKLPTVQKELDELKKASEGMDGTNPYEVKYNELKEEFENYKTEQAEKEVTAKKETAFKALLRKAGVSEKRIDAVLRVTDLSKENLKQDGTFSDEKSIEDRIKADWADFIVDEKEVGASVTSPNGSNGNPMSKADILAIKDTSARQKAIAENIELFQ